MGRLFNECHRNEHGSLKTKQPQSEYMLTQLGESEARKEMRKESTRR